MKDTQHGTTDVLDPVEVDRVQRILPAQPSHIPEEPLYQNVEETPEDPEEDVQPPPQGRVARAARGPRQAAHLGQATGGHGGQVTTPGSPQSWPVMGNAMMKTAVASTPTVLA